MSLSIYYTHTHSTRTHEWERRSSLKWERENNYWRLSFLSLGFSAAIGAHSISEEVAGFSPLWFPRGKSLCLLSLVILVVHVVLSDKILRSYCLNDKNITLSHPPSRYSREEGRFDYVFHMCVCVERERERDYTIF